MKLVSGHKLSAYLQLLATLYLILSKMRSDGYLAIENDVENPSESQLFNSFAAYDEANEAVYTFVCDVLRMMTGGNVDFNDMQRYMDAYRKTTTLTEEQGALFECARLTLLAALNGNAPANAVEHGRQGVLAQAKPTSQELDDFIRSVRRGPEPTMENIEGKLKLFYGSLGTE